MRNIEFRQVETHEDRTAAGDLLREYLEWLNERLESDYNMRFDVEAMVESDLADRHKFQPPRGRFYLALTEGQPIGVGCLKELEEGVGEVQRMYVPPAFRGEGAGRAIAVRLVDDAREIGYRKLRLESLEFLHAAHSLYRSLGFREIDPYADNSMRTYQSQEQLEAYYNITVFMELAL